jgi:tetratricopeptide (TPR) repeat protein
MISGIKAIKEEATACRAISTLAALMVAGLLGLKGREIAGAALQNATALALAASWREAMADPSSLFECSPRGNAAAAWALAEAALRLKPEDAHAWLLRGRSAWLAGRCLEAWEAWRHAVALAPQDPAAWLLYILSGPPDLRPEPAVAEGVAKYLDFQGERARRAERWEEALKWYERSLALAPSVSRANRLESVYLKLDRKTEAIARWKALAAVWPETDPGHWWALGRMAELSEDWEQAARFYGEGASRSDAPYEYRMRQGAALERLKDWAGAEAAYRRAVEARPDLPWPYLSVGHMRRVRKDYDGMLEWYRKAEAIAPNRYEPQYWLGYAHYIREEYAEAQKHLERALELNPQHPWSAYYLAWSLYKQGRREEAVSWLRTAIGLYPGQPWQWAVQLGDWLAEAGDKDGALAAYRQALAWKLGDEGIEAKVRALGGNQP